MIYKDLNKQKIGEIAREVSKTLTFGDVLLLYGELGSGKTFFVQKLCKHIKVKGIVNSPSYVLLNEYEGKYKVYHYDLYRLASAEEAMELGILERLNDGITIIEWPELIESYLPSNHLKIHFEHSGKLRNIKLGTQGYRCLQT